MPTKCFSKNHVCFLPKPRVVSLKTTCGFTQNHVWFHPKPRVVSLQTTCGFTSNHVWFSKRGPFDQKMTKLFPSQNRPFSRSRGIRMTKFPITKIKWPVTEFGRSPSFQSQLQCPAYVSIQCPIPNKKNSPHRQHS